MLGFMTVESCLFGLMFLFLSPSGIYSSLKDPLTLGGGVCSTPLSLGGGMCSTSLSSGLLQSHVSSLSLPSVSSNAQVGTTNVSVPTRACPS